MASKIDPSQHQAILNDLKNKLKANEKKFTEEQYDMAHGFYNQAVSGDNNTPKPGMLKLEAKRQWECWNKCKGMSSADAFKSFYQSVKPLVD